MPSPLYPERRREAPGPDGRIINLGALEGRTAIAPTCDKDPPIREREPDAPAEGLPDGASMLVFVTRRGPQGWQIVAATNVTEALPPGR